MTFQQLAFVVEIVRCGSINKAASSLFISQSNISNSIKELESDLGIKIFNRTNRGVELTNKGREFISFIRPILEQKEKVENFYSNEVAEPLLSFNVSSQRYPFTVDAFIRFLKIKNVDRYDLHIKETDMYKVIDDVYNNKSDIGIIFISDMTEKYIGKVLKSKYIEFNEIKVVKPHVFLRKMHPFANKKTIDINELYEYPYVKFGQENGLSLDFSEEISIIDFNNSKKTIYIHDRATAYNIIANTDAFSVGSGIIPKGFGDDRIITIPISNNSQNMRLGWIKIRSKQITSEIEDFISCLTDAINS
ncbi:LysR family transcriptional regulator [Sedimentibacter sp. zth1]|uniref:LysR family transcriptional regulator n=1 Tax=Sedimentibacter sp. zth1 TaxID=2816908 RepID=UPI001A9356DA|nr:LysR family transcriptional regulator [Sedimentibacter sp. zth1]QSX05077.1 LysR family transcriptional regulator [Sedimentibacter sp. zth1]